MQTAKPMPMCKPAQSLGYAPGQPFYNEVRAGLILKNTTLSAWCLKNGVKRQNMQLALLGGWRGPRARRLVHRLMRDLGLKEVA